MGGLDLAQYIVPLLFFALWALTWLFNREGTSPQARTGRPFEPGGPRPQPPFAQRTPERRPIPASQPRPVPGGIPDRDTGIIILETETRRPATTTPQRPTASAKRSSRGKSAPAAPPKRAEKSTPRALTTSMAQSMNPLENRPMDLKPLAPANMPLQGADVQQMSLPGNAGAQASQSSGLSAFNLRQVVSSPARLREMFVISEILGPPVSRRNASARPR